MADQHTTTTGPKIQVEMTREEAEILLSASEIDQSYRESLRASALSKYMGARDKLRAALAEQDHPAPSLGRGEAELLKEIARVVQDYAPEARAEDDATFLRDLAKRLRGSGS